MDNDSPKRHHPAKILRECAETFAERNKIYGENWRNIGPALAALFPNGITLRTAEEFGRFHLLDLMMTKISRLAVSGIEHQDSAHDCVVYNAMLEAFIREQVNVRGE